MKAFSLVIQQKAIGQYRFSQVEFFLDNISDWAVLVFSKDVKG